MAKKGLFLPFCGSFGDKIADIFFPGSKFKKRKCIFDAGNIRLYNGEVLVHLGENPGTR
jgi:hypothetical protein